MYRTGHNYRRISMVVGTPRNFENNQIVEMQFFIDYNERRGLQAIFGIFLLSSALCLQAKNPLHKATSGRKKDAATLQR